jgi:hypothetical protein
VGKTLVVAASLLCLAPSACSRSRCCEPVCCPPVAAHAQAPAIAAPPGRAELRDQGAVFLDATVLSVPEASAARVLGADARSGTRLSAEDGKAVLARAKSEPDVSVVAAPKILSLPGQRATIFVGETFAMEAGALEFPDDASAPNWAGQRLDATATASKDGTMGVDLSFVLRDSPPKDVPVDFGGLLRNQVMGAAHVGDLRSGDYVLVITPADGAKRNRTVVLMSAVFDALLPDPLRAKRLTVSFRNTPLRDVLRALSTETNVGLVVSPAVGNEPVTADFRDQDLRTILTTLSKDRFAWSVADFGVVRLTGVAKK